MRSSPAAVVLTVIVLGGLVAAAPAHAVPAFARASGLGCAVCHAAGFPDLGPAGRRFQERGFRAPLGAPGGPALSVAPISVQALGVLEAPVDADASGRPPVDLGTSRVGLRAGAALGSRWSFYASADLGRSPAAADRGPRFELGQAVLGVHDLAGGHLNLRGGRVLTLDFSRPGARSLTLAGRRDPARRVAVGLNPSVLDGAQGGADAYGRVAAGRLFYRVAILQGAQAADGLTDLDGWKDGLAELQWTWRGRHTLGALGYLGRTQITDEARGIEVRFTDPFWIVGGSGEFTLGPARLFGQIIRGRHQNPRGLDLRTSYWAGRIDADIWLLPRWVVVFRYDRVDSQRAPDIERELVTVHSSFFADDSVRLAAEYAIDVAAFDRSLISIFAEVAL